MKKQTQIKETEKNKLTEIKEELVIYLFLGLVVGLFAGLVVGIIYGLVYGLFVGLVSGLVVGLVTEIIAYLALNPEFSSFDLKGQIVLLIVVIVGVLIVNKKVKK